MPRRQGMHRGGVVGGNQCVKLVAVPTVSLGTAGSQSKNTRIARKRARLRASLDARALIGQQRISCHRDSSRLEFIKKVETE